MVPIVFKFPNNELYVLVSTLNSASICYLLLHNDAKKDKKRVDSAKDLLEGRGK